MFTTRLLTCHAIVTLTTPALSDQFFIVQEPGTNRCTITEKPPADGAETIVGDGAYGLVAVRRRAVLMMSDPSFRPPK
jgi:hypothetical protein